MKKNLKRLPKDPRVAVVAVSASNASELTHIEEQLQVFVLWHKRLSASAARGADCAREPLQIIRTAEGGAGCALFPQVVQFSLHIIRALNVTPAPPRPSPSFTRKRNASDVVLTHQTGSLREMHDITMFASTKNRMSFDDHPKTQTI